MTPCIPEIRIKILGEGKPIVLLHAFPLSHSLYDHVLVPPGHRVLLPDFPGFGDSPVGNPGCTLEDASRGLAAALKPILEDQTIVLGGVSMGGYWAMEFMRLFPGMVSRVVFIATRTSLDEERGRQKRLAVADRVENEGMEFLVPVMTPNLLGATALQENPELVQKVQQAIRSAPPKGVANAQRAMASRRDQSDTVRFMAIPGLWLAGSEDKSVNIEEARRNAGLNPGIRFETLEKVGHLVPWEAPESFQRLLEGFI